MLPPNGVPMNSVIFVQNEAIKPIGVRTYGWWLRVWDSSWYYLLKIIEEKTGGNGVRVKHIWGIAAFIYKTVKRFVDNFRKSLLQPWSRNPNFSIFPPLTEKSSPAGKWSTFSFPLEILGKGKARKTSTILSSSLSSVFPRSRIAQFRGSNKRNRSVQDPKS